MKDVVVVGGGIAGLTAGWLLRDLDTVVLEAEDRVGGRIKSFEREPYWVSVGAHMFPGEGSFLWGLLDELDLEPARIEGSLLGIAHRGKVVVGGRAETFPMRLSLSPAARVSMVRSGVGIKRAAARYNDLARKADGESDSDVRRRLLGYLDDRTWAEFVGQVHPQVEEIFTATANRLTAEPDQIAAGCMVGLFAHVWSSGGVVLGYNLRTGPASLPQELARRLGDSVVTGARVTEVARDADGVRVHYGDEEIRARCAIVAAPAPAARSMVADLPAETAAALDAIVYGPFVVGGILTGETRPMRWDDTYSVLTVDKSFNMLFNHANALRGPGPREPGGALMVYAGADRARRLLEHSDAKIEATMVDDLYDLYPDAKGAVREVIVQRWENAIPYAAPGRARVQAALEAGIDGKIFFAGDYVGEWTHMESAALTAAEAATAARVRLKSVGAPQATG
ncbi:MAG TPA: NAD(P)/FAD-dependent oxidoreductase [Gaiellaceae bacterium]